MTDRLMVEEVLAMLANPYIQRAEVVPALKQLADTMRENERLREALEWYKTPPEKDNELEWIMCAKTNAIEALQRSKD